MNDRYDSLLSFICVDLEYIHISYEKNTNRLFLNETECIKIKSKAGKQKTYNNHPLYHFFVSFLFSLLRLSNRYPSSHMINQKKEKKMFLYRIIV
jgi:hypothetical protein